MTGIEIFLTILGIVNLVGLMITHSTKDDVMATRNMALTDINQVAESARKTIKEESKGLESIKDDLIIKVPTGEQVYKSLGLFGGGHTEDIEKDVSLKVVVEKLMVHNKLELKYEPEQTTEGKLSLSLIKKTKKKGKK
jgi:hypothetical protein